MNITFFYNITDTSALNADIPFAELCDILELTARCEWHRSRKPDFPAMIFGECLGKRSNANMRRLCGLAADFDIGPNDPRYVSFDEMCDGLERDGYAFAAHTTTKNSAPHNKYRLLLPYAVDVPADRASAAWDASNAKFGGAIDHCMRTLSQVAFLPADWTGNPFHDPKLGEVTLVDPFSAVRVNRRGKPILSPDEIAALTPQGRAGRHNASLRGASRLPMPTPDALGLAEREQAARGKAVHDPAWRILGDLHRSPLVGAWLLNDLPNEASNRDYRFMTAVASKAIRASYPIRADVIASLAEQFSRERLNREPPHDVARQAENALAWAFRSSVDDMEPRQSEAGT